VVNGNPVGVLDNDLKAAAEAALDIPAAHCRDYALGFSWENCARQFVGHLAPLS
jgi:hypothetical protein